MVCGRYLGKSTSENTFELKKLILKEPKELNHFVMETKNIFIDTSTFRNKAFDLNNSTLKKLKELGGKGEITLLTTSITAKECEKHLIEVITECESKVSKLNVHLLVVGKDKIDVEEVKALNLEAWKRYLKESKVAEIPIYNGAVAEIFNRYFEAKPPFGIGNKKNEFPDAFVLETLKNWCKENKKKIYAISSDKPFSQYNEAEIIPLESIEAFLDLYLKNKKELEELYDLAQESFEALEDQIKERFSREFENINFYTSDLWMAEISDIKVNDVVLHKPYFTEVNEDFCHVEFDIDIGFSGSVAYDDENLIYRDSDTGELISLERIYDSFSDTITLTASVEIEFDRNLNPTFSSVMSAFLTDEIEKNISTKRHFEYFRISSR